MIRWFVALVKTRSGSPMFTPGYRADQIFETIFIARFADSTLLMLDPRTKPKTENLASRNAGTEFMLLNRKKIMNITGINCPEYSGEMTLKRWRNLWSRLPGKRQHSYISTVDYNFLEYTAHSVWLQDCIGVENKICWENENSYIIAYKIEKATWTATLDLAGYSKIIPFRISKTTLYLLYNLWAKSRSFVRRYEKDENWKLPFHSITQTHSYA